MNWKSLGAVLAGFAVVIVVTTLIDVVLHVTGVFPPMPQPLTDGLALLASSYRIPITIGGAWLTARLAPANPMKHAMAFGCAGVLVGLLGLVTTWNAGLGPKWYPISLVVLAIPESWAGGKLY